MAIAFAPVELPPGFRFHPTDQDLVNYYLKRKILLDVDDFIPKVDLYKYNPWELADKSFSPSRNDDEGTKEEWYLFGPRDRKYGTNGTRMNRATPAGFWKSTGKDRPVLHQRAIIGYKKTLVYHLGRAPNGKRTIWVMHEYRLHHDDMTAIQDACALCRVLKKKAVTPPLDVPRGAAAGEEEMKSVLGGAEADKDVPRGAAAGEEEMKSVLGGAEADKYVPRDAAPDRDGMQFVHCGADADVPRGAAPDRDGMQFVHCGADADEDGMQLVPGDVDADKEEMHSVPGGADADEDGMHLVPGDVDADNDNSWMQFIFDDAWYSSVDANMDESSMHVVTEQQERVVEAVQLAARSGAAGRRRAERPGDEAGALPDPEPLVAATGPSGEAASVQVARVDDGAAGLELIGGGGEGGGQEEDEE